jgi:hypothetical protein
MEHPIMKSRNTFLVVIIVTVLTFLFSVFPQNFAQASSTSLTFKPVADAFVLQAKPDSNYGSYKTLRVDLVPVTRSYLRFQVTGINGAAVQSAKLRIVG